MDVLGNALTLYDLGIRIATFINGLRHAQDDFLGLRAEADCLRICVNSLGSESCQHALYRYISVKQREDLKLIIANTVLNMKDLNQFLGSCNYLVGKEAKRMAKVQRKRDRWKDFLKEAWATYKFAMTDPQPFRDKLALPTASINIFLTSITHVGLANVGNLLSLSGHSMAGGVGGSAPPGLGTWEVIGQKVAFKRANTIAGADLTVDLEEEIIRYAMHLLKGGVPYHAKEAENKYKAGRSKSITKDTGSGTYVMRRKTAYVPASSRRTELVETEGRSQTDRTPLHLAAPASPPTPSSPRLLHVEFPPSSPSSPRIIHAEPEFDLPEDDNRRRDRLYTHESKSPRRQSASTQETGEARSAFFRTESHQHPVDLRRRRQYCRAEVEQDIKQEQEDAVTELRSKSAGIRSERRTRMFQAMKVEGEREDESDVEDVMEILDEEYGLKVERLYADRETIDNGTVAPVVPTCLVEADEAPEAEVQTIPPQRSRGSRLKSETSFYARPRRTTSSRYHSRYQPYDTSNREAYLRRRQTTEPRYRPDHFEHDLHYYRSDDSPPSEPGPIHRQRSSYPDIIIEHHDDAGPSKEKKRAKPRPHTNELGRSISDSGAKRTPSTIRKRIQAEDNSVHGARSRTRPSPHSSDKEDGSRERF